MSAVVALQPSDLTKIGIGVTIALLVIGGLLSMLFTALVMRMVILVVVLGLGVLVWQQRAAIQHDVKSCQLNMSFVGVHVAAPQSVVQHCQQVHQLTS